MMKIGCVEGLVIAWLVQARSGSDKVANRSDDKVR